MTSINSTFSRNDTIDCYPSLERGIKKILVVSEQKFKELQKDFQVFSRGLRGRISQRSSLLEARNREILRSRETSKASATKNATEDSQPRFRDYEPTKAISCNNSDWRRWVRVSEWFNQYAQGAEEQIFQKEILIQ